MYKKVLLLKACWAGGGQEREPRCFRAICWGCGGGVKRNVLWCGVLPVTGGWRGGRSAGSWPRGREASGGGGSSGTIAIFTSPPPHPSHPPHRYLPLLGSLTPATTITNHSNTTYHHQLPPLSCTTTCITSYHHHQYHYIPPWLYFGTTTL